MSKGDRIFQWSCSTADLKESGSPSRQSSAPACAETEKSTATTVPLMRFVSFIFMVHQRYVIAAFGEKRFNADMILILFLEILFRHVRGDGGKTIKADGIERAVLVASVGEEASCLKCHRESP